MKTILSRSLCAAAALSLAACSVLDPAEDPQEVSRFASDTLSAQDTECLLEAVYHEAQANHLDGGKAVAHVILNRKEDPRFPNSVCGVIAEGQEQGRCQFSYRCDGRAEVFADKSKLAGAEKVVAQVAANPEEDVTNGALFFHAAWMRPGWFATLKKTVVLGGQIFYQG